MGRSLQGALPLGGFTIAALQEAEPVHRLLGGSRNAPAAGSLQLRAIDCDTQSDPKQYLYAQRWTFDPMNRNSEKASHLTWPAQAREMNRVTLGNILVLVLGTRNIGDRNGWGMILKEPWPHQFARTFLSMSTPCTSSLRILARCMNI